MRHRPLISVLVVLLLSAVIAVPRAAAEPSGSLADRVDGFVTDYLDRHGLPGAAVAVTKDGELVHAAGFGHDSAGGPPTEDSPFRIASVSKPITAFAVLQLVDDGLVELDAPVADYVDDFVLDDQRAAAVTVRQLLSHTSGLTTPVIIPPATTLEDGVARIRDWQLATDPGTAYSYSNANYWVAARLVEQVGGVPFGDFLQRRIFEPLGMDRTFDRVSTLDPAAGLHDGHVTAYGGAIPAPEPEQLTAGAGGVVTTATDMARWIAMQQRDGRGPDGAALLSPELVNESRTPQPGAGRHGFGWFRSAPDRAPARISTSGTVATYSAQQDLVPDSGYGVVVLLNSFTPLTEHGYELSGGIIDVTTGADPDPGPPIATIVDLVLGGLTLLVLGLGVRGVLRAAPWADRRAGRPRWWRVARLLPQLIMPAAAAVIFLVVPNLQDNALTAADVFRLYPALMSLIVAAAAVGLVLTGCRARALRLSSRS